MRGLIHSLQHGAGLPASGRGGPRVAGLAALLLALLTAACPPADGDPDGGPIDGGAECESREDCDDGLVCLEGRCDFCVRDRECALDEMCDPVRRVCTFLEGHARDCATHDACDLGQFCHQGLCKAGTEVTPCGADTDCPQGELCQPERLVCEEDLGCFGDKLCPEGWYCDPGTNRCAEGCTEETAEAVCPESFLCEGGRCVECASDADCGAGLSCDLEVGRCSGASTCFSDRDCLRPLVCNRLTRQCTDRPPPCVSNDDCLGDERCDIDSGQCVAAACLPDALEPNDTLEEAPVIEPGLHSNLTLCDREVDWMKVSLGLGDRVSATVNPPPLAGSNYSLGLWSPSGTRVLSEGNLQVDHTVSEAGEFGLRVETLDARSTYSLQLLVSRGVPCEDDAHEENDALTEAPLLPAGPHLNLQKCPGDADWFLFEQPRDLRLRVTLTHDPLAGDLDLHVYDSDGTTPLAVSATTEADEVAEVTGSSAGRVFVEVHGGDRVTNAYDLVVETY